MTRTRAIGAAALAAAAAATGIWVLSDYRAWRALGVGGLPPTWRGWLTMTGLRLRATDPLDIAGFGDTGPTRLAALPPRRPPRPNVAPHPIPHRQRSDVAPPDARAALAAVFDAAVAAAPHLSFRPSHFEKHNPAVTLGGPARCADAVLSHGEIAHIHPMDGSMHMILAPADAATVIARGWGERHGLAGIAFGLPATYLMIYAPRDVVEAAQVATILAAAIDHMSRQDDVAVQHGSP